MILFDKFVYDLEKEIQSKKDIILSIDHNIDSLLEYYGSLSVTKRNGNKYYYLKRKEKNKLYSKYIGKDLSVEEINTYIEKNKSLKILKKRKKIEEDKLTLLIELEKKYKKAITI